MVDSTWEAREQPILDEVARAETDQGEDIRRASSLTVLLGMDRLQVNLGVRALVDGDYLRADEAPTWNGGIASTEYLNLRLLERGRRATGQWPAENAGEELLRLLEARADAAESDEERSKWRKMLDGAKALGGKALTEVAVALIKHEAGL